MNQQVQLHDLTFVPMIDAEKISEQVGRLGAAIDHKYAGDSDVLFVGVLNGAVVFMADLLRACRVIQPQVSFVRLASYQGTESTGHIQILMDLSESVAGRHVLVVEDVVDTGRTVHFFLEHLRRQNPASLSVATLLYKPAAVLYDLPLDFIGFEIGQEFVVGYGLDYDGLGRHLPDIYQLPALT
jgi:hypoxanthine phosphoribosyltransferase